MMWKFRLQFKKGGSSVQETVELNSDESVELLKCKILAVTDILPQNQILKTGRPPKPIRFHNDKEIINSIGNDLQNMDLIIVEQDGNTYDSAFTQPKKPKLEQNGLIQQPDVSSELTTTINARHFDVFGEIEPQHILPASAMASRVPIPSDNSCLFASILHCLKPMLYRQKKRQTSMDLRKVCSERIIAEEKQDTGSILMAMIRAESDSKQESAADYTRRILSSDAWGGELECTILSEYFQVQIVAGDIENTRFNKYPTDDKKYPARIYILFDGLHYDACEKGKATSIFACNDVSDVHNEVASLLFDLNDKRQYTNTNSFLIVCQDCNKQFKGEKEVTVHATQSGHTNFQERK